tara:strand:- start:3901 stop:4188 length:288 start_codon:yes stop_codon:yes gene_type:complete
VHHKLTLAAVHFKADDLAAKAVMESAEVTLIMRFAPHWTGFGILLAAPRTLITAMVFRQSAGFRGSSGGRLGEFAGDGRGIEQVWHTVSGAGLAW